MPLSLPVMAAFGLFYAVGFWNTYLSAVLYINEPEKWPLQILLQNLLVEPYLAGNSSESSATVEQRLPPEGLKMVSIVMMTVPIIMVYPFLQKHFSKGAMVGSIEE